MTNRSFWQGVLAMALFLGAALVFVPQRAGAARGDTTQDVLIQSSGDWIKIGTIATNTTATTNASTAVPFAIPANAQITIICDAAACILPGSAVTCTTGQATTGKRVAAFQEKPYSPKGAASHGGPLATTPWIAIATVVTGNANCDFFQEL